MTAAEQKDKAQMNLVLPLCFERNYSEISPINSSAALTEPPFMRSFISIRRRAAAFC